MTKYEEMVHAAKDARREWNRRNEAVKDFVNDLLPKFTAYCEIPPEDIGLLPWDEEAQMFQAKPGERHGIPQALSFDEENDEWRIGLVVYLSPSSADGGLLVVRVANKMQQIVNLSDPFQVTQFFDFLVKTIKESFMEPQKNVCFRQGCVTSGRLHCYVQISVEVG